MSIEIKGGCVKIYDQIHRAPFMVVDVGEEENIVLGTHASCLADSCHFRKNGECQGEARVIVRIPTKKGVLYQVGPILKK